MENKNQEFKSTIPGVMVKTTEAQEAKINKVKETYQDFENIPLAKMVNMSATGIVMDTSGDGYKYQIGFDPYAGTPGVGGTTLKINTGSGGMRLWHQMKEVQDAALIWGNGNLPSIKSEFEKTLDFLFTREEKEEFLKGLGYTIERENTYSVRIKRLNGDGGVNRLSNDLDSIFLEEMTIKFKNLLLAKPTLKVKI